MKHDPHPAFGPLMVLQVPRSLIAQRLACAASTVGAYMRGESALPEALAPAIADLAREQVSARASILRVIALLEPALIGVGWISDYARTVSFAHELAFGRPWSLEPYDMKTGGAPA